MKVLHVVPGLDVRTGGVAVSVVAYCRGLRAAGIETVVYATDMAGPAAAAERRRVRPDELPHGTDELDVRLFPARAPRRLAYSPALARELRRTVDSFDLVHVHSLWLHPQLAALRAAAAASVPFIVSLHGTLDPYLRSRGRGRKAIVGALAQTRLLNRAAALHVTTQAEAALAADVAPNVPRCIVPVPLDLEPYARLRGGAAFRLEHLGGSAAPVVLSLGRLAAKKGLDVLVRAFARGPRDARLVIAGPDDERIGDGLRRLAVAEGVGDRVVVLGPLYGDAKLAALAAADVWALPSHTENFGIAVAEALAAGVATVVSPAVNLAGPAAAAGALVVAPAEPEEFGDALASLLRSPERRRALGERARSFVRQYESGVVALQLAQAYRDATSRNGVAPLERLAHA